MGRAPSSIYLSYSEVFFATWERYVKNINISSLSHTTTGWRHEKDIQDSTDNSEVQIAQEIAQDLDIQKDDEYIPPLEAEEEEENPNVRRSKRGHRPSYKYLAYYEDAE